MPEHTQRKWNAMILPQAIQVEREETVDRLQSPFPDTRKQTSNAVEWLRSQYKHFMPALIQSVGHALGYKLRSSTRLQSPFPDTRKQTSNAVEWLRSQYKHFMPALIQSVGHALGYKLRSSTRLRW